MVEIIEKDLFQAQIDIVVHSANCQNTMSSGVAKLVKERFPEAYAADLETTKGDKDKLGKFSAAKVNNPEFPQIKYVINCYTQFTFGTDKRQTNYEAFYNSLEAVRNNLIDKKRQDLVIGMPYKIASDRGGASWAVIEAMIRDIFEASPIKVIICKFEPKDELKKEIV